MKEGIRLVMEETQRTSSETAETESDTTMGEAVGPDNGVDHGRGDGGDDDETARFYSGLQRLAARAPRANDDAELEGGNGWNGGNEWGGGGNDWGGGGGSSRAPIIHTLFNWA